MPLLLPRGTIYFESYKNSDIFLVEIPEGLNSYTYPKHKFGRREDVAETVKLSMPWQYFLVFATSYPSGYATFINRVQIAYIYWSKIQLTSLDDWVIPAQIPHVYSDGHSCLGDIYDSNSRVESTDTLTREFYSPSSMFIYNFRLKQHPLEYSDIDQWVNDSKKDPLIYKKWPEAQWRVNPIQLIQQVEMLAGFIKSQAW